MGVIREREMGRAATLMIREGTVKLERYSGDWVQWSSASCRDGRGAPLRCRFQSEDAKRRPGEEMALEVEGIVDGGVQAQEPLRRCHPDRVLDDRRREAMAAVGELIHAGSLPCLGHKLEPRFCDIASTLTAARVLGGAPGTSGFSGPKTLGSIGPRVACRVITIVSAPS